VQGKAGFNKFVPRNLRTGSYYLTYLQPEEKAAWTSIGGSDNIIHALVVTPSNIVIQPGLDYYKSRV